MRKIIFRGKRIDNGDWIYGALCQVQEETFIGYPFVPANPVIRMDWVSVDSSTVGQSTGLCDVDKVEIYEGDILIEPSVATVPLEVRYNAEQGAYCLVEHTHTEGALLGTCPICEMLRHYPLMRVVGNIYDNPIFISGL